MEFDTELRGKGADKPPILRFAYEDREDRNMSHITGKYVGRSTLIVYVRAWGDQLTETPHIVYGYTITEKPVLRLEKHKVKKRVDTGKKDEGGYPVFELVEEMVEEEVEKMEHIYEDKTEWQDSLKYRLRNKQISQHYFDYCNQALKRFNESG